MKYFWIVVVLLVFTSLLSAKPRIDFDGNGEVEFADFVLFASKFGSTQGDQVYEARCDMNNDGEIELGDFTAFAAEFDIEIGAVKIASDGSEKPIDVLQAQALEAAAKEYRDSGDYAAAVQRYKALLALATDPLSKAKGMKEIGITYMAMDSLSKASEQLHKALLDYGDTKEKRIKSQLVDCGFNLGYIYYLQNNPAQAIKEWDRAVTYFPPLPSE